MTAFDYARARATAERLISRFGQAGTLSRPTRTGGDVRPVEGAPQEYACTYVVTDYTQREIDGTRIKAEDKRVYISAVGLEIEPALSDRLVEPDGNVYKVIQGRPLRPAGTTVLWELQVRR